jgi:uncharacterized protein YfiM (DUF2279 family)
MKLTIMIFAVLIFINNSKSQNVIVTSKVDSTVLVKTDTFSSDSWFGIDKGQHFAGSFIGTILMSKVNNRCFDVDKSNSKKIGVSVVFSIGITKELVDSHKVNNHFSWKDLLANVAGIIAGVAIMEIK